MKKIWIIWLAAFSMIQGCSSVASETIPSSVETEMAITSASEEESSTAETAESTAKILKEDHLELVDMKDYSPVYYLTLKKIEGDTGNESDFTTAELTADPLDGVCGLIVEDSANNGLLSFSFWNVNEVSSIKFTIDNLDYKFDIPQREGRRVNMDQRIEHGDYSAMVKTADLYPKAIVLHLSDISNTRLFENNIFLNVSNEKIPPYDFYDDDGGGRTLLFVFGKEITVGEVESIEIGDGDEYVTTALNFTGVNGGKD